MKHAMALRSVYRVSAVLSVVLGVLLYLPSLGKAAVEGIPCTPKPTDMIINYGDLVNCQIDAIGRIDVFRFSGAAGDTVRGQTSKLGGAGFPSLEVHRPDGTLIFCNAFGNCPLNQTGTHTILVSELGNNQTVDYALALERIAPPSDTAQPIQHGQLISDEINGVGDIDLFFFGGEAGDTVRVQTSKLGGAGFPSLEVFRPDGTLIFCNAFGDCLLNQTGIHTILVSELGNNQTVEYSVTLECLSGVCPPVVVPDVSGCIKLKGAPLPNSSVVLMQTNELDQTTITDANGCYKFDSAVSGKSFDVIIKGPVLP